MYDVHNIAQCTVYSVQMGTNERTNERWLVGDYFRSVSVW